MTGVKGGAEPAPTAGETIYRHSLAVRITHWINVLVISLLLMSGLNIFNAHPRLYWGQFGADSDRPWFELRATGADTAHPRGVTRVADQQIDTTGVLGLSTDASRPWQSQ